MAPNITVHGQLHFILKFNYCVLCINLVLFYWCCEKNRPKIFTKTNLYSFIAFINVSANSKPIFRTEGNQSGGNRNKCLVSFSISITIPFSSEACIPLHFRNIFYRCVMFKTPEIIIEFKNSISKYHKNNHYKSISSINSK